MEEIIKKLDALGTKVEIIDKAVSGHTSTLEKHSKKLDEHTDQLEIIARTVSEHTEHLDRIDRRFDSIDRKLENMATKDDVAKILDAIDGIVGLTKRHDEEIVVLNYNYKKLDHRVEILEQKV